MSSRWLGIGSCVVSVLVGLAVSASPADAQVGGDRVCDGQIVTILGTAGDDRLVGTDGPDVIAGLQGNDIIFGLGGDDVICAGLGDDVVLGGQGFDIMFGAQGDDRLYAATGVGANVRSDTRGARMFGGAGNDELYGSTRWDRMQGGDGRDLLMGFEGQDWLRSGGSGDFVDGGPGYDDIRTSWGPDRIDVGVGDVIRAGLGRDHCNIDGVARQLWSCEVQPQLTPQTPFSQRVESNYHEPVRAPETAATNFEVFPRKTFTVDDVRVDVYTELEALPEQVSAVAFSGLLIDNGRGAPEACVGPILTSDPPGCGGPIVDGLDFHPSWTDYYPSTRLGSRAVVFSWPPVDGRVSLIEEFPDTVFAIDGGERPEDRFSLPDECADIDTFVGGGAIGRWIEQNPTRSGGIWIAEGIHPVLTAVGDLDAVRAELRTADAEPCVISADFSAQDLNATSLELQELFQRDPNITWLGLGSNVLTNRVSLSVDLADKQSVRRIAEGVTNPEHIIVSSRLFIVS